MNKERHILKARTQAAKLVNIIQSHFKTINTNVVRDFLEF